MRYKVLILLFIFSVNTLSMSRLLKPNTVPDKILTRIEKSLSLAETELEFKLLDYYQERNFYPIWVNGSGLSPVALEFVDLISQAHFHGLQHHDYFLKDMINLVKSVPTAFKTTPWDYPNLVLDIEVTFTKSFFTYAQHMVGGKLSPDDAYPKWKSERDVLNLGLVLTSGIVKKHLIKSIEALSPQHIHYLRMKSALHRYRNILNQNLWVNLNDGPDLQLGNRGARVEVLNRGLLLTNDLKISDKEDLRHFDGPTQEAVKHFQSRHLLAQTGIVDSKTRKVFNTPITDRIVQLSVNLERLRWLPFDLGESYILVNIAGYRMHYYEYGRSKLDLAVIVGKPYKQTPLFSSKLNSVVVNPDWRIPHSIAESMYSRLLPSSNEELEPIGFSKIKLSSGRDLLIQAPGPTNSLGKYKFVFRNPYQVYLHDTPQKELFMEDDKRASSGCIRLESAHLLAETLIRPEYLDEFRSLQPTDNWERKIFSIKSPTNVHIIYWSAWITSSGSIVFGSDPYQRDELLYNELNQL